MAPYNRLFNDDLGPGGWDNINAAHYALIEAYLNEHSGEGQRVLITFGAWHKYWLLDRLRARDDIVLLTPIDHTAIVAGGAGALSTVERKLLTKLLIALVMDDRP